MTAREMFDRLGYRLVHDNDYTMWYEYTNVNIPIKYKIRFYKEEKTFLATESRQRNNGEWYITNYFIDSPTFKAIHQQMKELGWVE